MQLTNYCTTALEDWVTKFYLRFKITHPHQIKMEYIARVNEIFIHKKPQPSFFQVIGRYRGITIDNREDAAVQRETFFHELAHLLRHSGVQSMLPAAFRELQERDARHFTRYAAIPFHMLKFIDFDDDYVIDQMADVFKVTPELARERLLQIKNRSQSFVAENRRRCSV